MSDEFGSDFMTIVDEDGTEFEIEVLSTLEYNGCTYLAVTAAVFDEDDQTDPDWIDACARAGFEYGADAVKVLCSSKDFDKVVKAVPVPVVMAGGPKTASLEDVVKYSVECGGKGCAIGRNVYGSEDPAARIKALRAIVHGE